MTQKENILNHIKTYGSVTNIELMTRYGIMHPTARISELRKKGFKIVAELKDTQNKYGEKIKIAVYTLEE